jgi:COMPASS component SPP1
MSNISALLNPAPASQAAHDAANPAEPSRPASQDQNAAHANTYEAADALTTLATLGSGQMYAPQRELPSPTVSFPLAPQRQPSFGSHATPVEPSPPIDLPQTHSPTLEQYHHSSKSPEEQRRQSLLAMSTPPTVLAPIQSLTTVLNDQIHNESPQTDAALGHDVSQIVPQEAPSNGTIESGRDHTQDREPGFVRDEPTTSQIREPESSPKHTPHPISIQIPFTGASDSLPSPAPIIKNEPAGTPREATPAAATPQSDRRHSVVDPLLDVDTLKAIEAVKQSELGLRAKKNASERAASVETPKPAMAPSKKRPPPKNSAAANKKGTASKKPATKKRKLDPEANGTADGARRSGTPSARTPKPGAKGAKKGSQAGTPAAGSSPAPDHSSQAAHSDEEADSSDDGTLYCICRKPDNHQWMIACDGGCDDWFHGSCVNIQRSDESLIDKYICPNCAEQGKGETTWKPMCRRDGCRRPANTTVKGSESKYCSEDCGEEFFRQQLQRTAGAKKFLQQTGKGSKRKSGKDGTKVEHMSDDEEEAPPLGGVLRAKDVKALALASKDIDAFRRLGSGVLSPPQTASPTKTTFDSTLPNGSTPSDLSLTPAESAHLAALHTEKKDLQIRLEMLKDREKFVSLAREHAVRIAERHQLKPKEFCGYDARLTWSDSEFSRWRNSKTGKAAFAFNTLSPTREQITSITASAGDVFPDSDDEEMDLVNGDRVLNGEDKEKEKGEVVCSKKRCNKHAQWQKLNLQDARFEEMEVVEAIRGCEKEERDVRERAARRFRYS